MPNEVSERVLGDVEKDRIVALPGKGGRSRLVPQNLCPSEGGFAEFYSSGSRERDGIPLHCSCLENPMDGGAWWATVQGVAKSWT